MKKIIKFVNFLFIVSIVGCSSKKKEIGIIETNNNVPIIDSVTIYNKEWEFYTIKDKTLFFGNGRTFKTNLFDLKYIGQLTTTKEKAPYFILSGRTCQDCDENISIYIHSPADGAMKQGDQQIRYSYPGKEEDYLTNKLVYENRMFYGSCLGKESCIWLQKALNENQIWENTIFIVELRNDTLQKIRLKAKEFDSFLPKLTKCSEVLGTVSVTEP